MGSRVSVWLGAVAVVEGSAVESSLGPDEHEALSNAAIRKPAPSLVCNVLAILHPLASNLASHDCAAVSLAQLHPHPSDTFEA